MDATETNERLRELGYRPDEARAERAGRGVRLTGTLLRDSRIPRASAHPVLAMLPPRYRLLAFRAALGLAAEGE